MLGICSANPRHGQRDEPRDEPRHGERSGMKDLCRAMHRDGRGARTRIES